MLISGEGVFATCDKSKIVSTWFVDKYHYQIIFNQYL